MKTSGPTVVVVDDDASVRASLARLFRSAGLGFQAFASAEEFLAGSAMATAGCLVADMQMPGLRGLDLQARCIRVRPALPIIIISAFDDPDAERQALSTGAAGFLRKPFDGEALVALVNQAIDASRWGTDPGIRSD